MTKTVEDPVTDATTTTEQPLRLAFIGAAGSGKTTHAKLMQKKYKGDVLSFATPLKKILRELFGERMDDPAFAREAAQLIGTDAIRKLDPMTWIRLLVAKIPASRNCYVDDTRFPNEYYALRNLGFTFVRVDAFPETLVRRRPTLTKEQAAHESEQHQLYFTAQVTVRSDPQREVGRIIQMISSMAEENGETPVFPPIQHLYQQVDDTPEDIEVTHEEILLRLQKLGVL